MPTFARNKRSISRSSVLRLIHESGGMAASEISRQTGLGTVAIKRHTDYLLKAGKIHKADTVSNGVGRPAAIFAPNPHSGYMVGVDMEGTHITAIVMDKAAAVISSAEYRLDRNWSGGRIISALADACNDIIDAAGVPTDKIEGVGFSLTGFIDRKAGVVLMSSTLPEWKNVPAKYLLAKALDYPLLIDDSVTANTLAEKWFGKGIGVDNFVSLRIRTSISLGMILNGDLYRGHGNAGTIHDLYVLPKHAGCEPGEPRTLFALASGSAILARIRENADRARSPKLWDIVAGEVSRICLDAIAQAATDRDPLCVSVLQEAATYWGRALARVFDLNHPQKAIVTGAFSGLSDILAEPLTEALGESVYPALKERVVVEFSELGKLAGAMGAAALVLRKSVRLE